jgi:hypothetical protein
MVTLSQPSPAPRRDRSTALLPRTRAYVDRGTADSKTMPEIIRCAKRYLARGVFNAVRADYAPIITWHQ